MPRIPYRPPQLRGHVFRARTVIAAGLLSRRQLASKAWRRLFQGVYADASVPVTYIVRCAVVVVFVLPSEAVIAGRSAVTIHGVGLGDPDDVEVLVPLATPTVPRLVLAGLPPPQVQFVILDRDGRFVARVDLAWDEYKLAVEYDGLWHVGSAQQLHDDRKRLNAVVGLGWTVLHVTAARLRADFDGVLREVRAAIRRRSRSV